MADYQGILICGEVIEGKITAITREIITTGRKLGDDLEQSVHLLLVGQNIQDLAKEAILDAADVWVPVQRDACPRAAGSWRGNEEVQ